jgi:hypothetical protein
MDGVARIDHSNLFLLGGLIVLASVSAMYLRPKPVRPEPSPSASSRPTATPSQGTAKVAEPEAEVAVSYEGGYYRFCLSWDPSTSQYSTLLRSGRDWDSSVKESGTLDAETGNSVKSELAELSKGCGLISESKSAKRAKYSISIGLSKGGVPSSACQFSDLDLNRPQGEGCSAVVNGLPSTYVGKLFASKGMLLPTADPATAETP